MISAFCLDHHYQTVIEVLERSNALPLGLVSIDDKSALHSMNESPSAKTPYQFLIDAESLIHQELQGYWA